MAMCERLLSAVVVLPCGERKKTSAGIAKLTSEPSRAPRKAMTNASLYAALATAPSGLDPVLDSTWALPSLKRAADATEAQVWSAASVDGYAHMLRKQMCALVQCAHEVVWVSIEPRTGMALSPYSAEDA